MPRSAFTTAFALTLLVATGAGAAMQERDGVLRVGTSGDYPPFSRGGVGFDVDVARAFARDQGLDIVWVPFTWPTLAEQVARGDFDVAMGGITWRADRAAVSPMTRAVAQGSPCVVGSQDPQRVAVNEGGILERFVRARWGDREVVVTNDNLDLPRLLASDQADAFVTDSFEVHHFAQGRPYRCEPARDRKAYWVAPGREALAERLSTWLSTHTDELRSLRRMHFGEASVRTPAQHAVDLLARRFAFMPHVARFKAAHGIAVTDAAQERRILAGAQRAARERALPEAEVAALFEVLIDLAKVLQERTPPAPPTLDLVREIRPALVRLTPRLLDALVPLQESPSGSDWEPLGGLLSSEEIARIEAALAQMRAAR